MFKISKKYYKSSLSELKKEIKLIQSQKELLIFLALGFTIPQIAGKLNKTPNNMSIAVKNYY